MIARRTSLTLLLAAAPALGAQATPQPAARQQTITFDDAVRIALRQNTTLRQAANAAELDAASVRHQRFNLLPDLRLTTNTGQNYGLSLMFLRRRGAEVPPAAKRALYLAYWASFAIALLLIVLPP